VNNIEKGKILLKQSLVYGLASSLQSVLGFLLLPILTQYYSTEEFGIYSLILLFGSLCGAVFYFGASSSLGRFYFDKNSKDYINTIISSTLVVTSLGALLFISGTFFFKNTISSLIFDNNEYGWHLFICSVSTSFGFLFTVMTLLLRYEKKAFTFLIITISALIINFSITYILLVYFNYGIMAPLYGSMFSFMISFFILFFIKIREITIVFNKIFIKKIFVFGIQVAISSLFFYLLDYIDRFIMKELLPMSDVGVYSLGYRIAAVINILIILPFSYVWAPIRMEYANNKNNEDFVKIVFSYFSLIGFMFIVFFILFTESILPIFIQNADFYEASRVIPLVMLGLFFYSYQNIIDFGIYLHQKVYYYIIVSILTIVLNVILNFWLLPKFGLISAAYITIISYLFSSTLIYIISNRYYKLKLEWKKLIILILLLITIYSIINFIKFEIDFLSKVLIYIILSFFIYKFWLNGSERNFLKTQLNNFNKI
tara:strand:- start:1432 stop:2886 length:1455 start_codon:yes stop_codon:yes gene_type:complete